MRKCLGDCGLTYAGLTYKARIVLLPTAEYLYNSIKLTLTADNSIGLAKARLFGKVGAIGGKKLL